MKKLVLLFGLLTSPLLAQQANIPISLVTTTPSASCTSGLPDRQLLSTGTIYTCQSVTSGVGTWTAIGNDGSSGFPITIGITSIASGSTTTSISGLTLS